MYFTVLVCGGRDFLDREGLFRSLDNLLQAVEDSGKQLMVVHGAAPGADDLAEQWAKSREVAYRGYPAKWRKHAKAAGPIRNTQMLNENEIDLLLAFPGGRGTSNMVAQAEAKKINVKRIT